MAESRNELYRNGHQSDLRNSLKKENCHPFFFFSIINNDVILYASSEHVLNSHNKDK